MHRPILTFLIALALVACKEEPSSTSSASSSASSPPPSASVAATPPPAPLPSAAPAPSVAPASAAAEKEVTVTVRDPKAEAQKTVKALVGGTVTAYLPDDPGTVWSVETADKALGKAKEEIIPGFAPGTNGHEFQWSTKGVKSGGTYKVALVNKKGGKPNGKFALTIEVP